MLKNGYVKADSRNLPSIDIFMVAEFIKKDSRFNAPELRLVKASMSTRESYGDSAVGYVSLKRTGAICNVQGKVCPEHRVRSKNYSVLLSVNTENNSILNLQCEDCPASEGGCKHALAFLMYLHRRSENRSPTDVDCYWNKPLLSTIGTSKKYIDINELYGKESDSSNTVSADHAAEFFQNIMAKAEEKQVDSQISRHIFDLKERELYGLSLHQLMICFLKEGKSSADEFIRYGISQLTPENCLKIEAETRNQKDNILWHEMRYGRITASILHETAQCKKTDGSLVLKLLGAYKKFDSKDMERGRNLEEKVILEIEKKFKKKLVKCGLILIQQYPVLGASPDARAEDFVVEIKCPKNIETMKNYINNGKISPKCNAQIQLQMLAAGFSRGLFCVADHEFESNKKIHTLWVNFDKNYVNAITKKVINFWKENIYTKLKNSIEK